jgi:hypothetical protein
LSAGSGHGGVDEAIVLAETNARFEAFVSAKFVNKCLS